MVADRLAAVADRADRQHHDPEREDRRAGLPAAHACSAARSRTTSSASASTGWSQLVGRWSMVDVFVDTFTAALVQLQPLMSVAPGAGAVLLRGGRRADDAGGRVLRSAADLGRRERERGSTCLTDASPDVPESRVVTQKRTRLSLVWIVPIVAAVAGAWVAVDAHPERGADDHDRLPHGRGARGRARRRSTTTASTSARSRRSGSPDDHQRVIATAQMAPKTEDFLVDDTQFWVVRPRISGANVTGLGTLISGAYVGMEIGDSSKKRRDFVALDTPPVVTERHAGALLRAEDPDARLARHGHADLLPAAAGGRGRLLRARRRREGAERPRVRERALRPVRHAEHALLAGERRRRVAHRERPQRADAVAPLHPGRRHRVRDARRRPRPAGRGRRDVVHALQRPHRGLQARPRAIRRRTCWSSSNRCAG